MDERRDADEIDGMTAVLSMRERLPGPPALGDAYEAMIVALRNFQDAIAGAAVSETEAWELQEQITNWSQWLADREVSDLERPWGHWFNTPGRSQALVPRIYDQEIQDAETTVKVRFGRFYVSENLTVYGGAISLLMDELLGQFNLRADRPPSRTAYLTTTFRAVVPVDVELTARTWIERQEGRKTFVRGELHNGDVLCAEADGLWIALRAGQP